MRYIELPSSSGAIGKTATPESGSPLPSVTRPVTAMPPGIVSSTPFFRSPEAARSCSLLAAGNPRFIAVRNSGWSGTTFVLKRPSGPLNTGSVLRIMRTAPSLIGSPALMEAIPAAATGRFSSSSTVPLTRASCGTVKSRVTCCPGPTETSAFAASYPGRKVNTR